MNVRQILDEIEREKANRASAMRQIRDAQCEATDATSSHLLGIMTLQLQAHESAIRRLNRWKERLTRVAQAEEQLEREESCRAKKKQKAA